MLDKERMIKFLDSLKDAHKKCDTMYYILGSDVFDVFGESVATDLIIAYYDMTDEEIYDFFEFLSDYNGSSKDMVDYLEDIGKRYERYINGDFTEASVTDTLKAKFEAYKTSF